MQPVQISPVRLNRIRKSAVRLHRAFSCPFLGGCRCGLDGSTSRRVYFTLCAIPCPCFIGPERGQFCIAERVHRRLQEAIWPRPQDEVRPRAGVHGGGCAGSAGKGRAAAREECKPGVKCGQKCGQGKRKGPQNGRSAGFLMVEIKGLEPMTSRM